MTFTILDSICHRVEMLLTKNGNSNPGDLKRLKNSSLQQYLIEFREAHRKGREKKNPKPILK